MIHSSAVVEMVPKGFHKGTGILEVCKIVGEDVKNTVAFGDSVNDAQMLEVAGTAVAMGRCHDEIRKLADLVTSTLEEDGILKAMQKLHII